MGPGVVLERAIINLNGVVVAAASGGGRHRGLCVRIPKLNSSLLGLGSICYCYIVVAY